MTSAILEVLFDIDGVLVHPWRFRDLLSRDFGITPERTKPFFSGPMQRCAVGEADLLEELPTYLAQWGWTGTLDDFVSIWFDTDNAPNQPVLGFAVELRAAGVPCHIASTQEQHRAQYLRTVMGLEARFDSTFFSCDVGFAKPDPAYFKQIETSLRREPHWLLFLDDAIQNIEAARHRGWHAVHFRGEEDLGRAAQIAESLSAYQRGT